MQRQSVVLNTNATPTVADIITEKTGTSTAAGRKRPTTSTIDVTASRGKSGGKDQPTQEQIAAALTKRWEPALGKNIDNVLEIASILFDAKETLEKAPYGIWLKSVAKMSEGTASKHRSIHECPLLHKDEFKKLLPPDWTVMYQLSRFSHADQLTPVQAKSKIGDALAYIRKESPTTEELSIKVNQLLGKLPKAKPQREPAHEPERTDPVTGQPVAAMRPATSPLGGDALEQSKVGVAFVPTNSKPEQPAAPESTEPTEDEIEQAEMLAAQDDGVEVDVRVQMERFRIAQMKIQIRKLVKASGIDNVRVVIMPRTKEAAA